MLCHVRRTALHISVKLNSALPVLRRTDNISKQARERGCWRLGFTCWGHRRFRLPRQRASFYQKDAVWTNVRGSGTSTTTETPKLTGSSRMPRRRLRLYSEPQQFLRSCSSRERMRTPTLKRSGVGGTEETLWCDTSGTVVCRRRQSTALQPSPWNAEGR